MKKNYPVNLPLPIMTQELRNPSSKPIAIWLLIGVGMIIIQILLGGITRLTGSGLSITEWNVVTGTLPPLNEAGWLNAFHKYQQTPQYHYLNADFTLKDFKFIFFWEWFHRLWARLIGVVFLIPFVVFLIQKRFRPSMVKPMMILFLLGALQGAIGWIMVASGLTGDAVYVRPTRLALHFIFALGLLSYTYWFSLALLVPGEKRVQDPKAARSTYWILGLLFFQLIYGALMAGHKAATAAPTWPDINGKLIPDALVNQDGWLNWIDNRIAIHFIHRGLAYLLVILIILLTLRLARLKGSALFSRHRWWPLMLVLTQTLLGILAVLNSLQIIPNQWGAFEWLAQFHQVVGMCLLLSLLWVLYMVRGRLNH